VSGSDSFTSNYLAEVGRVAAQFDQAAIDRVVDLLVATRERGGRAFFIGSGGGAGNASHAVCDFRKLAGLESYCPTDNVSELTAQINDHGWESSLANWLVESRLNAKDLVLVFSVGGGSVEHNVSMNLVRAMELARSAGASIAGVVGRDGGFTAQVADACVIVPTVNPASVTAHTEAFQAVIWHLLVSHPRVQRHAMAWESKREGLGGGSRP
jgi:D-sedoheptulose 7-phosphate isomerase